MENFSLITTNITTKSKNMLSYKCGKGKPSSNILVGHMITVNVLKICIQHTNAHKQLSHVASFKCTLHFHFISLFPQANLKAFYNLRLSSDLSCLIRPIYAVLLCIYTSVVLCQYNLCLLCQMTHHCVCTLANKQTLVCLHALLPTDYQHD